MCSYIYIARQSVFKRKRMNKLKEIWDNFRTGKLSMNQADDLIAELGEEREQKKKETKHIQGRYDGESLYSFDPHIGIVVKTDGFRYHSRVIGTSCATEEEAQLVHQQQESYLELIDKIHELNDGWTPDWGRVDSLKYAFNYCIDAASVQLFGWSDSQHYKTELYFESEKIGSKIIEELGEDLIKLALWGIE